MLIYKPGDRKLYFPPTQSGSLDGYSFLCNFVPRLFNRRYKSRL